jgi:hypothetical protein
MVWRNEAREKDSSSVAIRNWAGSEGMYFEDEKQATEGMSQSAKCGSPRRYGSMVTYIEVEDYEIVMNLRFIVYAQRCKVSLPKDGTRKGYQVTRHSPENEKAIFKGAS